MNRKQLNKAIIATQEAVIAAERIEKIREELNERIRIKEDALDVVQNLVNETQKYGELRKKAEKAIRKIQESINI